MVPVRRDAGYWRVYAAIGVGALCALAIWAIAEPRSAKQSGAETHCEYTYQTGDPSQGIHPIRRSTCHETASEPHEDDAYDAAYVGSPASLLAAFRHYLHKMIMDPVSALTLVLAMSTVALWMSTRRLWKSAEAEFISTHRPRLQVRNIVINKIGQEDYPGKIALVAIGETISGQFYVANNGDTDAVIEETYFMFHAVKWRLEMKRPYEGRNGNVLAIPSTIPPGRAATVMFTVEVETDAFDPGQHVAVRQQVNDMAKLYAMGWIEYSDGSKTSRRMSFCRLYREGVERFMPLAEPDADYEFEG